MKRLVFAAVFAAACGGDSDETTRELAIVDLPCSSFDAVSGSWESAKLPEDRECAAVDSCCPWIELPGDTTIRLEHALGRRPRSVAPSISFTENGVGSTVASGDSLRLLSADDTHVVVQNNTDQRFYFRIDLR